jgi:hypothetical protein
MPRTINSHDDNSTDRVSKIKNKSKSQKRIHAVQKPAPHVGDYVFFENMRRFSYQPMCGKVVRVSTRSFRVEHLIPAYNHYQRPLEKENAPDDFVVFRAPYYSYPSNLNKFKHITEEMYMEFVHVLKMKFPKVYAQYCHE